MSTASSDLREALALTWVESVSASLPLTRPCSIHCRITSSNSLRNTLRNAGFRLRSCEIVLWSGTRSNRSRPRYQRNELLSLHLSSICRSEGIPYKNPINRYFTITTGSIGGRPYPLLYRWAVSSYTSDRSSEAASFHSGSSSFTGSSIVTM